MNINKVILYGNITKDIEIKSLPNGMAVISFSLATNRQGKTTQEVEYHNIVAFGKQAEAIKQYTARGNGLYVEGRLQTRSWDGQDGKKNYRTEIILENFQFGYQKAQPTGQTPIINQDDANQSTEELNPSDIPF